MTRPEARGSVRLKSADPAAAPAIQQNFLSNDHDWAVLREAVMIARKLAEMPQMKPFIKARYNAFRER